MARETNFVQRKNKITGSLFLELIVFNNESLKSQSLNDMAVTLKEKHCIDITKQSLQERFNCHALLFLKKFLEKIMQDQIDREFKLVAMNNFSRILIKDSVCFQIHNSLATHFPGSGGSGSKAAVRIQFEYNILTGTINDLSINAFNDQDVKDSQRTIGLVEEGDLIIRDLAYMIIPVLSEINQRSAYFICRLRPTTNVYEKCGDQFQLIKFSKLLKYMNKNGINSIEKDVYVGNDCKLNCRLVIDLLPQKIVNERIRKAVENNKKKGRSEPSKEYKCRCHFNLFITNTDQSQVPFENVILFYRLRWQIELIFKIWKSLCNIEKVKKVNRCRLECYIYAKLIFIMLSWQIVWRIAKMLYILDKKALSYYKAFKTLLRHKIDKLYTILKSENDVIGDFMLDFYKTSLKHHLLESKSNKMNSLEILLNCSRI